MGFLANSFSSLVRKLDCIAPPLDTGRIRVYASLTLLDTLRVGLEEYEGIAHIRVSIWMSQTSSLATSLALKPVMLKPVIRPHGRGSLDTMGP